MDNHPYLMFVDWILDLLIEGPFWLIDSAFHRNACPKCGGRLKYRSAATDELQCVMCDRVWQKGKGRRLIPIDPS